MTQEETEKIYVKLSNSAHAFINDKVMVTNEYADIVYEETLYREFITYCHAEKLATLQKAVFTKTMLEYCNGAERTRINKEYEKGKYNKIPCWRYIKINIGQNGQNGQGFCNSPIGLKNQHVKKSGIKESLETMSNLSNLSYGEAELIASHCKKWHTGACTFPGDPNCVTPANPCPKTCGSFEFSKDGISE
jgi:hypothetical protein